MIGLHGPSLCIGLLLGFLFAGSLGYLLRRVQEALHGARAPDRSMVVPTAQTPRTVMRSAAKAFRQYMMWLLVLILIVGIGGWLLYRLLLAAQW